MKNIIAIFFCLSYLSCVQAQELPRRSFLGIQMENITADTRRMMEVKEDYGVLVQGTVPGSTAEAAGIKRGDILLSLNGTKINDVVQAVGYVAGQNSGSSFTYELLRDKKKVTGSSSFKEYPREKYPDLDVSYETVKTATGLQRLIITKSKGAGKKPVLVFLGGIGCYSLESPMDSNRNEVRLINALARNGFMIARVEKPGIGDGAGHSKKCEVVSFTEEKDVYVQAVKDLKKRADVQADNIYVLGHSMGGVMAPMVATETSLKGIIAYGTIGTQFMEYLAKTRKTIGEANGWSEAETEAYTKEVCECSKYFFVDKMTAEQAGQKKSGCKEHLDGLEARSRKYNDELYAVDYTALWKPFTGKALMIWGKGDFISSQDDHQILTNTINKYHPGNATMVVVSADHGMSTANSFREAATNPGQYNPEIYKKILDWLKSI